MSLFSLFFWGGLSSSLIVKYLCPISGVVSVEELLVRGLVEIPPSILSLHGGSRRLHMQHGATDGKKGRGGERRGGGGNVCVEREMVCVREEREERRKEKRVCGRKQVKGLDEHFSHRLAHLLSFV